MLKTYTLNVRSSVCASCSSYFLHKEKVLEFFEHFKKAVQFVHGILMHESGARDAAFVGKPKCFD